MIEEFTIVAISASDLSSLAPVHITMGRLTALVRGTATMVAVAAAIIGTVPPLSWAFVGPVLAGTVAWTSIYVYVSWSQGVRAWIASIDLALAAGLCLAIGRLEPAGPEPGSTWVGILVSMIVICAQPARPPLMFLAGGLAVAASYVVGADLWNIPETGYSQGLTIAGQAIAGAVVLRIVTRAGRNAAVTFTSLEVAEHTAATEAEKRADERQQMRILHNGPVTTLSTAVNMSGTSEVTPLMRARAADDLATLSQAEAPANVDRDMRLDERLAQSLAWFENILTIASELAPCVVPAPVAEAFAIATVEALENVARHAGVDRASVRLAEEEGAVVVVVRDHGRGFRPDNVPQQRFGIRESIVGQIAAIGGTASVLSRTGHGTEMKATWRRD